MKRATLRTLEVARQAAQQDLDTAKSAKERNVLGQFATPSELAVQMAEVGREQLLPDSDVRLVDPSVGSGVFFYAARQAFAARISTATGFEIDENAAAAARQLWGSVGLDVCLQDFCTALPPTDIEQKANLILCNPPYVRHHHLGAEQKQRLRRQMEQAGYRLSGLSGLYCYFLLLADRWMAPNGVAVWIVPAEFLDVNYGKVLKEYLSTDVTLLRIHRFDPANVQFNDALVSSVILVFRKATPSLDSVVELTTGRSLVEPQLIRALPLRRLNPKTKWGPLFTGSSPEREAPESLTVGDLFTVKRGLATGANSFFILPRKDAADLQLPERFLRPILPSPRDIPGTLIDTHRDGFPKGIPQLVLVDCDLGMDDIRQQFPALATYLERGESEGIPKRYLTAHRRLWYSQEQRPSAPIICTYMGRQNGRGLRFIRNMSLATAPNVYLMLYPKPMLAAVAEGQSKALDRVFTALMETAAHLPRGGRVYGGGLNKIEPKELEALHLPESFEHEHSELLEFRLCST